MKKVLIVTGETSGDLHGARLISEIKKIIPDLRVFGIGGEKLKREGVELVYHIKNIAVVGISEVIPKIFRLRKAMKLLYQKMVHEHPDLCLLIDFPGFNLRFAKLAKKQSIKVVYYILPQIWAWGRWRIRAIHRWIDKGISILPFEPNFYSVGRSFSFAFSNKIEFVGHPLLDILTHPTRLATRNSNTIALLPGSRKEEIKRILPVMLRCAEMLNEFEFVIPVAQGIDKSWVEKLVTTKYIQSLHSKIKIVDDNVYEVLRNSKLALVASGTSTLEACILEVPMIIIYKLAFISYIFSRLLVRTPWIGLPNIIAGEEVVPEFIQLDAKPKKIVGTALHTLKNREQEIFKLREIKKKLGSPGAAQRAAKILYNLLTQ